MSVRVRNEQLVTRLPSGSNLSYGGCVREGSLVFSVVLVRVPAPTYKSDGNQASSLRKNVAWEFDLLSVFRMNPGEAYPYWSHSFVIWPFIFLVPVDCPEEDDEGRWNSYSQ